MVNKTGANALTYILGILSLSGSFMIYILYRSSTIPLVSFAERLNIKSWFTSLTALPSWMVYSLPDGLWLMSYEFFVAAFWKYQYQTMGYLIFALGLPGFAIICEILQYPEIIRGTYDFKDLLCYILAAIIGIQYCRTINKYCIITP